MTLVLTLHPNGYEWTHREGSYPRNKSIMSVFDEAFVHIKPCIKTHMTFHIFAGDKPYLDYDDIPYDQRLQTKVYSQCERKHIAATNECVPCFAYGGWAEVKILSFNVSVVKK